MKLKHRKTDRAQVIESRIVKLLSSRGIPEHNQKGALRNPGWRGDRRFCEAALIGADFTPAWTGSSYSRRSFLSGGTSGTAVRYRSKSSRLALATSRRRSCTDSSADNFSATASSTKRSNDMPSIPSSAAACRCSEFLVVHVSNALPVNRSFIPLRRWRFCLNATQKSRLTWGVFVPIM